MQLHNKGLTATQILKRNVEVQDRNKRHRHELSISAGIRQGMKEREVSYQRQISSLASDLQSLEKRESGERQDHVDDRETMTAEESSILDAYNSLAASLSQVRVRVRDGPPPTRRELHIAEAETCDAIA